MHSVSKEKLHLISAAIEALYRKTTETEEYLVAARVRSLRIAQKFSQKQLADMLGISTSHLANLENGNEPISISMIQKLCSILHVEISQIMCDISREDKILEISRIMEQSKQQLDSETYKYLENIYTHILSIL